MTTGDEHHTRRTVTVKTAPNIALIKYWGKADVESNIPFNPSISLTLDYNDIRTTTTVTEHDHEYNQLVLNGKSIDKLPGRIQRMINFYNEMKAIRNSKPTEKQKYVRIESENNFPTASGMASSASAMSSISLALSRIYGIEERSIIDKAARLGSGSACRSMYGGFVEWCSDEDSLPKQVYTDLHWNDIRVMVLVFDQRQKAVSSSNGMQRSIETSDMLRYCRKPIASHRVELAKELICGRNFNALADLIMRDSNQLHAICLDTHPPITYLNNASFRTIQFVHLFNDLFKPFIKNHFEKWTQPITPRDTTEANPKSTGIQEIVKSFYNDPNERFIAYTFDAGPNAFLFTLSKYLPFIWAILCQVKGFNEIILRSGLSMNEPLLDNSTIELAQLFIHSKQSKPILVLLEDLLEDIQLLVLTKPGPDPLVQIVDE